MGRSHATPHALTCVFPSSSVTVRLWRIAAPHDRTSFVFLCRRRPNSDSTGACVFSPALFLEAVNLGQSDIECQACRKSKQVSSAMSAARSLRVGRVVVWNAEHGIRSNHFKEATQKVMRHPDPLSMAFLHPPHQWRKFRHSKFQDCQQASANLIERSAEDWFLAARSWWEAILESAKARCFYRHFPH